MYAGTTIGDRSGNSIGAHQRIDKIARKHLIKLLPEGAYFPATRDILYFEGNNGPDAVKRKSPSVDEPWHFIDPNKAHDVSVVEMIMDHIENLAGALKKRNNERAAFEAAWLAHAVVDGLTPAHHFPLADKIEELFGVPHHERAGFKQKNIIKGLTRRDTLTKNWEYWGSRGIFSTHFMFEWGVAATMIGRVYRSSITPQDLVDVKLRGYEVLFRESLFRIVEMDVYELFHRVGWNWRVARIVHKQLLPEINRAVTLAWYTAIEKSGGAK
jgi:hypothetical protein